MCNPSLQSYRAVLNVIYWLRCHLGVIPTYQPTRAVGYTRLHVPWHFDNRIPTNNTRTCTVVHNFCTFKMTRAENYMPFFWFLSRLTQLFNSLLLTYSCSSNNPSSQSVTDSINHSPTWYNTCLRTHISTNPLTYVHVLVHLPTLTSRVILVTHVKNIFLWLVQCQPLWLCIHNLLHGLQA